MEIKRKGSRKIKKEVYLGLRRKVSVLGIGLLRNRSITGSDY
uniref:Uncharacterized protein n=1 Tax=Methanosarcina thermophila TaxID=2210 RepID=Q9UXR5_METTE|nr:hypothetical protein [Methanosarcina thermophila TM-1]